MYFSAASTSDGLIQEVDRICGTDDNNYTLKAKTARINQALDRFTSIALTSDGFWTFDDLNKGDLPIGTADLVSGQQDYEFADEILVVQKVLAKDASGNWSQLEPANMRSMENENYRSSGNTGAYGSGGDPIWTLPSNNSGTPNRYQKFAHSLLLDPIPNYASTAGLKVVFKRNTVKFVSTNTDTECGIPSIFHPYICRMASLPYLSKYGTPFELENLKVLIGSTEPRNRYYGGDEKLITDFFALRSNDEKPHFEVFKEDNR